MIRKASILVGIFFLLVSPLFGGEQGIDFLRQKYLPPNVIPLMVTQVVNLGYPSIDGDKMFSRGSIYLTTFRMNYGDAKGTLEDKGIIFVEIDREDTKRRTQEFQKVNPWMIPDYKVSMGESEEEWQFILSTHRFDTVTGQWVKETTLRIIIPSEPPVQEQVPPSPPQTPPEAQTSEPSLQPTKPVPAKVLPKSSDTKLDKKAPPTQPLMKQEKRRSNWPTPKRPAPAVPPTPSPKAPSMPK